MRDIQGLGCYFLVFAMVAFAPHTLSFASDENRGEELAKRYCLRCHDSSLGDAAAVAPPLSSFSEKWPLNFLEEALAEGIVTGHDNGMPIFTFSAKDIADLLAYIETLPKHSDS